MLLAVRRQGPPVVLALALLTWPRLLPAQQPGADEVKLPAILTAKALQPAPGDSPLRKLLIARYNEAVATMKYDYQMVLAGKVMPADLFDDARRVVKAGLAVTNRPADRVKLLTQLLELAKQAEVVADARRAAGQGPSADLHRARYLRLDIEIQLLRARAKADTGQAK